MIEELPENIESAMQDTLAVFAKHQISPADALGLLKIMTYITEKHLNQTED